MTPGEGRRELQLIERPLRTFNSGHELSDLDPVLQSILINRGIESKADCDAELSGLLPFQSLKDIDKSCEILGQALNRQSKVLVIGDFDADGATSTVVAIKGLKALGFAHVSYLVPDRFKFGYGLSPAIVDLAHEQLPDLIITVDNGISSIEGVRAAKDYGISVLVTDHHLPGKELPEADAILNPNQAGCSFPSKSLAGVGVMFYLLVAFRAWLREKNHFEHSEEPNLASLLDLVALGTIVDLVPLDTNNRRLVRQGLARIRAGQACQGLKALIEVSGKEQHNFRSTDFAFAIGPRINAAGRLDSMSLGIECLLGEDRPESLSMAQALNDFNEDRKQIEGTMKAEALALIPELLANQDGQSQNGDASVTICLFDERWHQGVVGIVASRLKEDYHLPSVIFAQDDENPTLIKGSARSVKGLHMRDLLDRVATRNPGLLKKFGGHAMAAGMSIEKSEFDSFKNALEQEARLVLEEEDEDILQARVFHDPTLSEKHFNLDFAAALQSFEPWGQHFPEPVFLGEFFVQHQRILSGKHLKMSVKPLGTDLVVDAIAFNVPESLWQYQGENVAFLYRLDVNEYRGMKSLQLMVEKIIPPDGK